MSWSVVHKNRNSAVPSFGLIVLISFYTLNIYPGHYSGIYQQDTL